MCPPLYPLRGRGLGPKTLFPVKNLDINMFLIYVLSVFIKYTFMEDVVLKGALDKNVAAVGLVFSFTLAAYAQVLDSPEEPAAYSTRVTKLYFLGPWG